MSTIKMEGYIKPGSFSHGSRGSSSHHSHRKYDDDPNKIWDYLPKKFRGKKRQAYIRRHSDVKIPSTYKKFALLMWKNSLVARRRWKATLAILTVPVLYITILVIWVFNTRDTGYTERIYKPFKVHHQRLLKGCKTVYFLPENYQIVNDIKTHMQGAFIQNLEFKFLQQPTSHPVPSDLCALIEFHKDMWKNTPRDKLPPMISYDIRFPAIHDHESAKTLISMGDKWDTAIRYPTYLIDGSREVNDNSGGYPGYDKNGFLYVQYLIARELSEIIFMTEVKALDPTKTVQQLQDMFEVFYNKMSIRLSRFPFPAHKSEDSVLTLYLYLPTTLFISFGISCLIMVYLKVREREMGVWKMIEMYGIGNSFHIFAWILHHFMYLSLCSLCIILILSVKWKNTLYDSSIIEENSLSQLFLMLLLCYVFQVLCTMTFLVSFFSVASTACISIALIWCVLYTPYVYIHHIFNVLTFQTKIFCCASCNTALGIGCHLLAEIQASGRDVTWDNLFAPSWKEFSIGWLYVSMILYGIAILLIARYLTHVHPEGGMAQLPWNYLCKIWYWKHEPPPDHHPEDRLTEKSFQEMHPECFEDDRHIKKRKELCIDHLTKYHGNVRAIHKVNLVCHQGHITALLGKEGSGKSSLLKMLTGTMAPSSGTIYLNRKDLYKDHLLAKAFVGYCPSENLLFPDLTVEETIQFFTDLKGLTHKIEAYEDVERTLKITNLTGYRNTRVCDLQKGIQRILMVATAFCGGSRVVLLDDPTLNLSLEEEKLLWDFAGQEKKHRTVVVGMDFGTEVDYVVDKIAIMHKGQVTTRGSPEFLQTNFGAEGGGYSLEIETKPQFTNDEDLRDIVEGRITGSNVRHQEEGLIIFYIPPSQNANFPGLLEELENSAESLFISNFRLKFETPMALNLVLRRFSREAASIAAKYLEKHKRRSNKSIKTLIREINIDVSDDEDKWFSRGATIRAFHEFKLMFFKNIKNHFKFQVLFWGSIVGVLLLLILIHLLVKSLELEDDTASHPLNFSNYRQPYIMTDINRATNEGVFMKHSVDELFRKGGARKKNVPRDKNIISEMLNEYNLHDNENEVPLLGLEISPVRELENGEEKVKVGITGYFNNQPLHTPAVALALADNILLHHMEGYIQRKISSNYKPKGYFFNVSNHPLDYQPPDLVKYSQILFGPGYVFGICSSFAYTFLVASYIVVHIKQQTFIDTHFTGGTKVIYWIAFYLWNFIHFSIVAAIHILLILAFGVPGYLHHTLKHLNVLPVLFVMIEMYGLSAIFILGSFASRTFKSWGRGFSKVALIFVSTGPLLMMLLIPLQELTGNSVALAFFTMFHNIFLFFPNYAFGTGMYYIIANEVHRAKCKQYDKFQATNCASAFPDFTAHPFNEFKNLDTILRGCCFRNRDHSFSMVAYGIGRNLLMMSITILFCIGEKIYHTRKKKRDYDHEHDDDKEKGSFCARCIKCSCFKKAIKHKPSPASSSQNNSKLNEREKSK